MHNALLQAVSADDWPRSRRMNFAFTSILLRCKIYRNTMPALQLLTRWTSRTPIKGRVTTRVRARGETRCLVSRNGSGRLLVVFLRICLTCLRCFFRVTTHHYYLRGLLSRLVLRTELRAASVHPSRGGSGRSCLVLERVGQGINLPCHL